MQNKSADAFECECKLTKISHLYDQTKSFTFKMEEFDLNIRISLKLFDTS